MHRRSLLSRAFSLIVAVTVTATACSSGGSTATRSTHRVSSTAPTTSTSTTAAPTTTLPPLEAAPPPTPAPIPAGIQVLSKVPVPPGSNVVFLTIDDGLVRNPEFTQRFERAGIPVTIFPVSPAVDADPAFFRAWIDHGAVLGDHTIKHPDLHHLGLDAQKHQICDAAANSQQTLGVRPRFFRPPYGNYNDLTKQAMQSCGLRYIIMWHAAVNNGQVQFQGPRHLEPGDIILMHFRTTFDEDFDAALARARQDGMKFGNLADYLPE